MTAGRGIVHAELSPRQFLDTNLLATLDEILGESGMAPELLQLEITESMVMLNVERAVRLMIPFLIWPWVLLPLGTVLTWHGRPLVSAPPLAAVGAAAVLMAYGWYVAALLRADGRGHDGNHPAWTHMYALMMLAQIALALAYLA